ncbi:hypothetical protein [uncultured Bartonella sp.]|nr:hypothetical protein [uncultured Bartonella sp.]
MTRSPKAHHNPVFPALVEGTGILQEAGVMSLRNGRGVGGTMSFS